MGFFYSQTRREERVHAHTGSRWIRRARAVSSSLSLRLFLYLTAVIFLAFTVYAWFNVRTTSRQYERTLYEGRSASPT